MAGLVVSLRRWLALAVPVLVSAGVAAADVELVGVFGSRAVLVVDGGAPRTMSIGQTTPEGVRLIGVSDGEASVEIGGQRRRLALGQAAIRASAASPEAGGVVLFADSQGHYLTQGSINGASVRFLVDTGATMVSMGASDARRAGIAIKGGAPGVAQTASGAARVWKHRLDSVRVGEITLHGVDALVHENDLPFVLLGMSFLNRMDMQREGSNLVLRRRY